MGFLNKVFNKNDESENEKMRQEINIDESKENLNEVLVDLSKKSKVDLTKHTARVALAMDYSGLFWFNEQFILQWICPENNFQIASNRIKIR